MAESTPTQLRNPRRSALAWLAAQLAWERTLDNLRNHSDGAARSVKAAA